MVILNIFTDGSLRDGKCGYGIYFPNGEYKNISKKFILEPITNNRAELYAIYVSMKICRKLEKEGNEYDEICIYSDSEYSVNTINKWYDMWKKNGKKYKNGDIIDKIMKKIEKMQNVKVIFVRAHTGKKDFYSISNDKADELAKNGAEK